MSDYNLIIHLKADKFGIGHMFAELRRENGKSQFVGFGPLGQKTSPITKEQTDSYVKSFYGPGAESGERDEKDYLTE